MEEARIIPVIQNSYLISRRFTSGEIRDIFNAIRASDQQGLEDITPLPQLMEMLCKEGFTDDGVGYGSFALIQDTTGIDAYASPRGRFVVLTVSCPNTKSGIHPAYLENLVKQLESAGLRAKEIRNAKRVYHNNPAPYDWNTATGKFHLAGVPR